MSNFNATGDALNQNLSGALGRELALMAQQQRSKDALGRSPIRALVERMADGGMNRPELPPFDPTDRSPLMANGYLGALQGQDAVGRLGMQTPVGYQQGFNPPEPSGLPPVTSSGMNSREADHLAASQRGAAAELAAQASPQYAAGMNPLELQLAQKAALQPPADRQLFSSLRDTLAGDAIDGKYLDVPQGAIKSREWLPDYVEASRQFDRLTPEEQANPANRLPVLSGSPSGKSQTYEGLKQNAGYQQHVLQYDQAKKAARQDRRDAYAQTQQDLRNGVNPAIRQLLNDPMIAGGGMGGGMMNPLVAALQFGGDAMGHVMQGNAAMAQAHAQAQNGMAANQIAMGNQRLQERMVNLQEQQAKMTGDAKFEATPQGDAQAVAAYGGFDKMPEPRQVQSILRVLDKHGNSFVEAEKAGAFAPLQLNAAEAAKILGPIAPPFEQNILAGALSPIIGSNAKGSEEIEFRKRNGLR